MLSESKTKEIVDFWRRSSQEKLKTMKSLYASKRYADCLFFGHLILEKILKSLVVQNTKAHAPHLHNLLMLVELSHISLTQEERQFLIEVNEFNLSTRYPDFRLEFYKLCNKRFADKYYQPILFLYQKLCRNLKQKI